MKKILALILAILMILSVFTACGKGESVETEKPTTETETEKESEETKDEAETDSSGEANVACSHLDENKDHSCDKCNASVGEHTDPEKDGNHICDYCGVTLTTCKDSDNNHSCDDCGVTTQHSYQNGVCTICKDTIYVLNGNKITLGTYPQTEVKEESLVATLNGKAGTLPTSENSQSWTSYGYYHVRMKNYMWYIDVVEAGEKYRGVYFTDYRVYLPGDEDRQNPSYQDDNGYTKGKVYWFKYEPISWTILDNNTESGVTFILCDMIIDSKEYYNETAGNLITEDETISQNNYAHSTIRKWLNETFYNMAFNELQRQLIMTTIVGNGEETAGKDPNIYACENTRDKVFLLSWQDVVNNAYGFSTNGYDDDPARRKKATDYAQSQGTYTNSGLIEDLTNNSRWWLRSPDDTYGSTVRVVLATGSSNSYREDVDCSSVGVLPALQINLTDKIHTCADSPKDGDHRCDGCISVLTTCNDGDGDHSCDDCGVIIPHNYQNGVCTICKDAVYTRVGNKITFGSYPQTLVDDYNLITTLNDEMNGLPSPIGSGDWTSYGYYVEGKESLFMWYIDIEVGNEKYRGVYFISYRPLQTENAYPTEYSNQHRNGYIAGNVYWFKYEPITWTILSEDTNQKTALILCDMVIDSQAYYTGSGKRNDGDDKTIHENNYEYSTIREWLNSAFYDTAFSDLQKSLIIRTTVDNSQSTTAHSSLPNNYVCNDTIDKVFLLSYQEAINREYGLSSEESRRKKPTDYAQAQGVERYGDESNNESYGNSPWWLRTPYLKAPTGGYNVLTDGDLHDITPVSKTYIGIVPALQIKLYDANHDCVDSSTDDNHKCDECEVMLSVCKDTDKDHICDECGAELTVCNDVDKDHDCEICGAFIGICADSASDGNHSCDYCNAIISICTDSNLDDLCDDCGYSLPFGAITPSEHYTRDGNKITFGIYPQSRVTDEALINELNNIAWFPTQEFIGDWVSYGYYKDGSNEENFMWYIDIEVGNEKYRGVYFTSYRPRITTDSSSAENSYQDDNGYSTNTVYWFKFEPLTWTILNEDTTTGTALILCDMVIDAQEYYKDLEDRVGSKITIYPNNYVNSTIGSQLGEIYDIAFNDSMFDPSQELIILTTTVDNSAASTAYNFHDYTYCDSESKMFLLSYKEVTNEEYGFSSVSFEFDAARGKQATDYAQAQGAFISPSNNYNGNSMWWLRSPAYTADTAFAVTEPGSVSAIEVNNASVGVVPVLRIKL